MEPSKDINRSKYYNKYYAAGFPTFVTPWILGNLDFTNENKYYSSRCSRFPWIRAQGLSSNDRNKLLTISEGFRWAHRNVALECCWTLLIRSPGNTKFYPSWKHIQWVIENEISSSSDCVFLNILKYSNELDIHLTPCK